MPWLPSAVRPGGFSFPFPSLNQFETFSQRENAPRLFVNTNHPCAYLHALLLPIFCFIFALLYSTSSALVFYSSFYFSYILFSSIVTDLHPFPKLTFVLTIHFYIFKQIISATKNIYIRLNIIYKNIIVQFKIFTISYLIRLAVCPQFRLRKLYL